MEHCQGIMCRRAGAWPIPATDIFAEQEERAKLARMCSHVSGFPTWVSKTSNAVRLLELLPGSLPEHWQCTANVERYAIASMYSTQAQWGTIPRFLSIAGTSCTSQERRTFEWLECPMPAARNS